MNLALLSMSPIVNLPFWGMFVVMNVMVLVAINIGYQLARIRLRKSEGATEGPVGSVVGTVLGLLAFMLAFTFSIAAGRFDTKKQLLLDDVNTIGTTALRAQLLPEPHQTECRQLLKRYVDIRVNLSLNTEEMTQALAESLAIQDQLWKHAMDLARADMNSDIGALFVESLNQMIDLHTSRVTIGLQYRIPPIIWFVLSALTILSMIGVGFQFGIVGRHSVLVEILLAISFSLIFTLIADLDKSSTGLLKVCQKPMLELQAQLSRSAAP
jgi:hypothetical protein